MTRTATHLQRGQRPLSLLDIDVDLMRELNGNLALVDSDWPGDEGDAFDYLSMCISQGMEKHLFTFGAMPYSGDSSTVLLLAEWAYYALWELNIVRAPHADRSPEEVLTEGVASDQELRDLYAMLLARLGIWVSSAEFQYSSVPLIHTVWPTKQDLDTDVYLAGEEFILHRYIPIQLYLSDFDVDTSWVHQDRQLLFVLGYQFHEMIRRGHTSLVNATAPDFTPIFRLRSNDEWDYYTKAENDIMIQAAADQGYDQRAVALRSLAEFAHPANPLMNVAHPNVIDLSNHVRIDRDPTNPNAPFGQCFTPPTDEDFGLMDSAGNDLWFGVGTVPVKWGSFSFRLPIYLIPVHNALIGFEISQANAIRNPMLEHFFSQNDEFMDYLPTLVPQWKVLDCLIVAAGEKDTISLDRFLLKCDVARTSIFSSTKQENGSIVTMDEADPAGLMGPVELALNNVPLRLINDNPRARLQCVALMAQRLASQLREVVLIAGEDQNRAISHALQRAHRRFLDVDGDVYAQLMDVLDSTEVEKACEHYCWDNEELLPYFAAAGGTWDAFTSLDLADKHRLFLATVGMRALEISELFLFFQGQIRQYFSLYLMTARTFQFAWDNTPDAVIVHEAHTIDPVFLQGPLFSGQVTLSCVDQPWDNTSWQWGTPADISLKAMSGFSTIARASA